MNLMLLIIQILTAIPAVTRAIMDILGLIYNLPKDQRGNAQDKLRTIICKAKAKSFVAPEQAKELEDLLTELRSVE